MIKVKRALISVSDKTGLVDFAKGLQKLGVEIISTGGTAELLRSAKIKVQEVSEYTGFPEMLDGRVKTLHPKIHGGLLAVRDNPEHMKQIAAHDIGLIDMVVVNLYPFEKTIQKKNISLEDAIENIDIGGPSMLRSAAKNYKSVAVICNAERYNEVLNELNNNGGILSDKVLTNLAIEVFERTCRYDSAIYEFLNNRFKADNSFSSFPKEFSFSFSKLQDLRYGENPHQAAAFYKDSAQRQGLAGLQQLQGKELSFNNILDLNAAVDIIREFEAPAAVIIKHNNPCGVAQDKTLDKAYVKAYKCDPLSAFGGIIGFNRSCRRENRRGRHQKRIYGMHRRPWVYRRGQEPFFQPRRIYACSSWMSMASTQERFDFKKVSGGLLLQEKDNRHLKAGRIKDCQQDQTYQITDGGHDLWLEIDQACQKQCHCPGQRHPDHRYRLRADQPCGLRDPCHPPGGKSSPGKRLDIRCVLAYAGHRYHCRQGRGQGHYPDRRFHHG